MIRPRSHGFRQFQQLLPIPTQPFTVLCIIGTLGVSILAGILVPSLIGFSSSLRTALLIPLFALVVCIAILFGRILLLYLLAFIWFVPIATAGVASIPITVGVTVWELLLWSSVLITLASGQLHLARSSTGSRIRVNSVNWMWLGLVMVAMSSLLAVGRVSTAGYGQFRYAVADILCLLLLCSNLVSNDRQLKHLVLWFLAGAAGFLIFQMGTGGFEWVDGRLEIHIISLDAIVQATPNYISSLTSPCVPFALCLGLDDRSRKWQLAGFVLYVALMIVTFLTFSRGQIITIALVSLIAFLWAGRSSRGAALGLSLSLGVAIALIGLWLLPTVSQFSSAEGISNIANRLQSFAVLFEGDSSVGGRLDLIRLSFDLLRTQPLGVGYGRIFDIVGMLEHNIFMTVLDGSGVVGLMGLLLFFFAYTVAALKAVFASTGFIRIMCMGAFLSIFTMLVNGLTLDMLYPTYAEPSWIAVGLGLAAVTVARKQKAKTERQFILDET